MGLDDPFNNLQGKDNREKRDRNELIRTLWKTGLYSSVELSFWFEVSRTRVTQICNGAERRMDRCCRICERCFTARHPRQKVCKESECMREYLRRYKMMRLRKIHCRQTKDLLGMNSECEYMSDWAAMLINGEGK